MYRERTRVPYDEFAAKLEELFERVARDKKVIIVEKADGTRAVLRPAPPGRRARRRRTRRPTNYEAFRSAAGGWKDVDTDRLIKDIYADRRISDRPPVDL